MLRDSVYNKVKLYVIMLVITISAFTFVFTAKSWGGQEELYKLELSIVTRAVKDLFPDYTPHETARTVEEVLAVHHLVYHETKWHKIDKNVALVHKYEQIIKGFCMRYQVPFHLAIGVITWENSGGAGKSSYTGNVGFGQLSHGAVALSHAYGANIAHYLRQQAREYHRKARNTGSKPNQMQAINLQRESREYDLTQKHKSLAEQFHVADERAVPLANIEDSVVFLKILLKAYADRSDLAIAAYHNGMKNMDDLLWLFIERKGWGKRSAALSEGETAAFLNEIIKKHKITFISLWEDNYIREIMSGFRAMSGNVANEANSRDTLGDESDLYPWKITGALGAYGAGEDALLHLQKRYMGRKDQSDTDMSQISKIPPQVGLPTVGLHVLAGAPVVTPALLGLIKRLGPNVIVSKTGSIKKILICGLLKPLDVPLLSSEDKEAEDIVHSRGMAVDIDLTNYPKKDDIRRLLKWWYHFDRIYLMRLPIQDKIVYHIAVNPKYRYEFEKYAVKP